ncbi:MAG: holo-ACP synthase [Clostridia bacterium]
MKIGTDIVSTLRIEKVFSKNERLEKCFSKDEIEYCESKGENKIQSLSGLFAGKEAVSKAFGFGIGGVVSFLSVNIVHDENGSPHVKLLGKTKDFFDKNNWKEIEISISHCNEFAIATCIIV